MKRVKKLSHPFDVDFGPKNLKIQRYRLPSEIGNAEAEELAARIIAICQEEGAWYAVNLHFVGAQLQEDMKNFRKENISTVLALDASERSFLPAIALRYLHNNGYFHLQKEGNDTFAEPTTKLIRTLKHFVV